MDGVPRCTEPRTVLFHRSSLGLARPSPRTRYCETRGWAVDAACRFRPPIVGLIWIRISSAMLWRIRRTHRNSGRRRKCRYRGVRIPDRLACAEVVFDQIIVGKRRLRILVQVLHVGVGRRIVEVEVIFFDILAMVAFAVCQAKEALFEDRIEPFHRARAKQSLLFVVRNSGQSVFAPTIGARASLIVGKVVPGIAVIAVVFAHRAPLPLTQVRAPFLPGDLLSLSLMQTLLFVVHLFGLTSNLSYVLFTTMFMRSSVPVKGQVGHGEGSLSQPFDLRVQPCRVSPAGILRSRTH